MSIELIDIRNAADLQEPHVDILIVGGGFSGTMLATHLLLNTPLSVAVLDRKSIPGRGLAYSTPHRFHLLNVPAGKMSAFPDQPDHFLNWARIHHDFSAKSRSFLPRSVYGAYVGSLLEAAITERGRGRFRWIKDEALSVVHRRGGALVQRRNGRDILARAVILATGNFPPGDPMIPGLTPTSSMYYGFPWASDVLTKLAPMASVLLIGTGLTSLDLVMALKSTGFAGPIHILSRKGQVPHRYQETQPWPTFWNSQSPRSTRGLLRLIRKQVKLASESGVDWRSVIDSLRPVTPKIWRSLPVSEQKRFLRHLRSYWEAHRHRIAPEIADLFLDMKKEGQVRVYTGRITRYSEQNGRAEITYIERGGDSSKLLRVHRVINCTGSETDCRRIADPLIRNLLEQGHARPDPLYLALEVDRHGALLDVEGTHLSWLFAIGPIRKGCLWETTAVPEIRQQAAALAQHLADTVRKKVSDNKVSGELTSSTRGQRTPTSENRVGAD